MGDLPVVRHGERKLALLVDVDRNDAAVASRHGGDGVIEVDSEVVQETGKRDLRSTKTSCSGLDLELWNWILSLLMILSFGWPRGCLIQLARASARDSHAMPMLCQVREYQWRGGENDAGRQAELGASKPRLLGFCRRDLHLGDSLLLVWGRGADGPAQQICVDRRS